MNLKKSIQKRVSKLADKLNRLFAPAPLRTYDHIVSLGFNCEVAFQFLKYHDAIDSHLFNWCYIYSIDALTNAISSLDSVGLDFKPLAPMWQDANHMINFHGRGKSHIWKNDANPSLLQEDKKELISRVAHLKDKFQQLIHSSDQVLFVYKPHLAELNDTSAIAKDIIRLRNTIADSGMTSFDLLIIVTHESASHIRSALSHFSDIPNIIVESIASHAPIESVTEGPFDKKGWQRIWALYNLSRKLKSTKKKFKFDH